MFLIISRWLKDKKNQDAKVKFLIKSVLFCYEKFWKAALLEELINL